MQQEILNASPAAFDLNDFVNTRSRNMNHQSPLPLRMLQENINKNEKDNELVLTQVNDISNYDDLTQINRFLVSLNGNNNDNDSNDGDSNDNYIYYRGYNLNKNNKNLRKINLNDWKKRLNNVELNDNDINELILDYFVVECDDDICDTFLNDINNNNNSDKQEMDMNSEPNNNDTAKIKLRYDIKKCILNGDILKSIELINKYDNEFLNNNELIYYNLKKQYLIELIRNNNEEEAITYAQNNITPIITKYPKLLNEIENILGLIAFDNYDNLPNIQKEILSDKRKQILSNKINTMLIEIESNKKRVGGESKLYQNCVMLQYYQDMLMNYDFYNKYNYRLFKKNDKLSMYYKRITDINISNNNINSDKKTTDKSEDKKANMDVYNSLTAAGRDHFDMNNNNNNYNNLSNEHRRRLILSSLNMDNKDDSSDINDDDYDVNDDDNDDDDDDYDDDSNDEYYCESSNNDDNINNADIYSLNDNNKINDPSNNINDFNDYFDDNDINMNINENNNIEFNVKPPDIKNKRNKTNVIHIQSYIPFSVDLTKNKKFELEPVKKIKTIYVKSS